MLLNFNSENTNIYLTRSFLFVIASIAFKIPEMIGIAIPISQMTSRDSGKCKIVSQLQGSRP